MLCACGAVQRFFLRYATKAAKPSAKLLRSVQGFNALRTVQSCFAAFKRSMRFARFDAFGTSTSQPLNVSTS